jgi:hypothetical protein
MVICIEGVPIHSAEFGVDADDLLSLLHFQSLRQPLSSLTSSPDHVVA